MNDLTDLDDPRVMMGIVAAAVIGAIALFLAVVPPSVDREALEAERLARYRDLLRSTQADRAAEVARGYIVDPNDQPSPF